MSSTAAGRSAPPQPFPIVRLFIGVVGAFAIVVLLALSPGYRGSDRPLECRAVLDPSSITDGGDCAKYRDRNIGWAVAAAVPTSILLSTVAAHAGRRRSMTRLVVSPDAGRT